MGSGAIIAAVVERAKSLAIKRSIETKQETHLTRADLAAALQQEYAENDLFPPTDITEDWLKLTDFDPENVIKLAPIRPRKKDSAWRSGHCLSADNMIIQFGTETEIGIAREKEENLDVVAESMALVRSATKSGVLMRWDYNCEDPHADMRGFHVEQLRQDADEAGYFAQDAAARTDVCRNQERPGAGQRRPLLQRSRPPGILHARMRHGGGVDRARPRRRADS